MATMDPGYGPLVETNWLADHLDDPDVRVLECPWRRARALSS